MMVLTTCPSVDGQLKNCFEGTYEFTPPGGGKDVCELCPTGTYMPYKDHSHRSCFNCIQLQDPTLEILISQCNRTHNAVIQCIKGYYRQQPKNPNETGTCVRCTQCQYPYYKIKSCQIYEDTGCCPGENFDIYINKDGVGLCRERPWFCRKGHYVDDHTVLQCLPCPAGTFMPFEIHTFKKCIPCQNSSVLPLHAIVIQSCNSTHPDIIQCQDGYYLNHSMGPRNKEVGCTPCTDCSKTSKKYECRKCDHYHDADCCWNPNMTVDDNTDGPEYMMPLSEGHQTTSKPEAAVDEEDHKNNSSKECLENSQEMCPEEPLSPVPTDCEHGQSEKFLYLGVVVCLIILCLFLFLIVCYQHHKGRSVCTDSCYTLVNRNGKGRAEAGDGNNETDPFLKEIKVFQNKEAQNQQENPVPNELTIKADVGKCDNIEALTSSRDKLAHGIQRQLVASNKASVSSILTGNGSMEFRHGDGDHQLPEKQSICCENSGCLHSILIEDFDQQHVHNDRAVFNHIRTVANLTVQVIVRSKHAGIARFKCIGSGMVNKVIKRFTDNSKKCCPCVECQRDPQQAKTCWGMFQIVTSASLVNNVEECQHTKCKMEINDNEGNIMILVLKGVEVVDKHENQDVCIMHCIIHDGRNSEALEKMVFDWESMQGGEYSQDIGCDVSDASDIAIISYTHGLEKYITLGKASIHQKGFCHKLIYDTQTCRSSRGAPVCVLGKIRSSDYPILVHSKDNESGGFWIDHNDCIHSEPRPPQ